MKTIILTTLFVALTSLGAESARVIQMETKKIDGAVHWYPEKVEVKPGEKVKFVVQHNLEGGFDFHGFFIPELKVTKQVDRHKATDIETTIPSTLKEGNYKIGCHFHPAHVPATLVVKK